MWTAGWSAPRVLLCALLAATLLAAAVQGDEEVPSEKQCRPYVEKALKELEGGEAHSASEENNDGSKEAAVGSDEQDDGGTPSESDEDQKGKADVQNEDDDDSKEGDDDTASVEVADEPYTGQDSQEDDQDSDNSKEVEGDDDSKDDSQDGDSKEDDDDDSKEDVDSKEEVDSKEDGDSGEEKDNDADSGEQTDEDGDSAEVADKNETAEDNDSGEDGGEDVDGDSTEDQSEDGSQEAAEADEDDSGEPSVEEKEISEETVGNLQAATDDDDSKEDTAEDGQSEEQSKEDNKTDDDDDDSGEKSDDKESKEEEVESKEDEKESDEEAAPKSEEDDGVDSKEDGSDEDDKSDEKEGDDDSDQDGDSDESEDIPEEDLLKEPAIPTNLKSRDHIIQILRLDDESSENEVVIERSADIILRDLKRIYENNIKPLEVLYKYRDLSNRHFGDPEIFSKPLLLLMGPWSGGKSSIINYLTDIEYTEWSLRTGAEPSPAYFNILMHGKEPEVLDGTQLAADWTFSGLQKFGQGLEERLRGLKYPSKLLEKINIVEIPGILEVRKQVSRVFPFNDACQWFIDRADIIFLVYDPSKLDVGPETEAILDQLKGRESQVRIVLNKADVVKPEELLRVQGALIWNISPLMSSAAPPALYATSLWAKPLQANSPTRLLAAQERALLTDLRVAIDRRIDNKISSARRFAVRVRNHAKMVDCYLTTYYNHKTIFGNKKVIAEAIIEHPQHYHIYEGLSTLTNISRYDLPDPESYRDFFRLNSLYDFQPLSSTCTYFRGCPINRLDVAIAYDLPELVGKYKKMVETAVPQGMPKS